MGLKKILRSLYEAVWDHNRPFSERVFIGLTAICELTVFIALIGDILTGENIKELILLLAILVAVPSITIGFMAKNKLTTASRIVVAFLVIVVLPSLFFFGGGVEGGGVLWFVFAYMYVGLVISGKWRIIVSVALAIIAAVCFLIEYIHPEWVLTHTRKVFYIDFFISLVLVGTVCSVMSWLQSRLFIDENERAKKEAKRAEELTRSQNRFFSSMSHEIRTPINSILGLNELVLRNQEATDEIVRDASGIQGAGKLLLALINDILDFSKIEAGSMEIVPVDYRIGELLSEVVNMIWLKANEKGLKFNVSVDPGLPSVLYGDEVRIKQIIINLLNNAVKYTAEGSIELHVEMEEMDENKKLLLISVTDTGMGIKKEALPHLFDAFKRVDEEKNRHIEGTGLGLSIVRQLVELMNGTVKVNSIYGAGSTFTVSLPQGMSDPEPIGELNIHNQSAAARTVYESSFQAPEARILIVDDNEMNLEVECRLMDGTDMFIDTATGGSRALELANTYHYDVILMDHLMPEMDGIECLEKLRSQVGSLNRATPVVVLTANAGSDTKELYSRVGFDGYLVKPVSGASLEAALIKYLPKEKVFVKNSMGGISDDIRTTDYTRKDPVIITTTSLCDLPDDIEEKLNLAVLPFRIKTEEGTFKDYVQMGADELVRYMRSGREVESAPPDGAAYTDFFADVLKRAHNLIHIAVTTSMSSDYRIASEAARSFDNVTVINSECISSATGILVLIACKLAQQNLPVSDIIEELEAVKRRIQCSFIIDTTEYMAKRGRISSRLHSIARAFNLHPCIRMRDDMTTLGGIWMGWRQNAYKQYIKKAFPVDIIPDSELVFITYADVPMETLLWIREEISRYAYFEHVVFKQASAAISSNCGPGAFGIMYFVKTNKAYNIGSYISQYEEEYLSGEEDEGSEQAPGALDDGSAETMEDMQEVSWNEEEETGNIVPPAEPEWYRNIEGIDAEAAIANSGSEDAFKTVLKIFYETIPDKAQEIEGYYRSGDWQSYTIKVHALKSSAKLIGALELSDKAQLLEDAGKASDLEYISGNHEVFMDSYLKYREVLAGIFEEEAGEEAADRPLADEALLESVYEGLREAADAMDHEAIEEILGELGDYSLPEGDSERIGAVRKCVMNYDYDGILQVLGEG